jgi:hypothetical protein
VGKPGTGTKFRKGGEIRVQLVMIALRSPKVMKIVAGATEPGRRGPQGTIFERVPVLRDVPQSPRSRER